MNQDTQRASEMREEGVATASVGAVGHTSDVTMPGGYHIISDHPPYYGGADTGPQPIDLMIASLVSCKVMLLRAQADKKGWPMRSATVTARHKRVSARSLGEGMTGIVDFIDCDIDIKGDDLTDEQRRRLLELAGRCWVEHALVHETRITSRLVDPTDTDKT